MNIFNIYIYIKKNINYIFLKRKIKTLFYFNIFVCGIETQNYYIFSSVFIDVGRVLELVKLWCIFIAFDGNGYICYSFV